MTQPISSDAYLTHVVKSAHTNPVVQRAAKTFHGVYLEVAKLELAKRGQPTEPFDYEQLKPELDRIRDREDMAEFGIPALVHMLKAHRHLLLEAVVTEIEETLIGFRYWLDEPGEINACYFTENHQPLYHSAEYLVGDLFPDRVFPSNNQTGAWHKQHAETCMKRWMGWRKKFGFSEW